MRCPFCQHDETQVRDSRPTEDGASIRRRRQCASCQARFTTFERVQLRDLVVAKRSGRREAFDREKLTRSVSIALRKRPVDEDNIERMITDIVRRLEKIGDGEVQSATIGEMVMAALADLDQVAYVRYASVYRDFRHAGDFRDFLGDLPKPPRAAEP